ncbi:MAG: hypothetical protein U0K86_11805 [Agathobacter sp.]|nr:hypothetical protein [Agathobacter sp.]
MGRFKEFINRITHSNRVIAAIALSSVVLISTVSITESSAYFTTYATAQGSLPITLGPTTKVREKFKDWTKSIQVENTGKVSVFARVKIFAGSQFTITANGTNWSKGDDGYWYYSNPIDVGELTDSIDVYIKVPENVEASFDVVVVQECVPVEYDEFGNAIPSTSADWVQNAEYIVDDNDSVEEKEAE